MAVIRHGQHDLSTSVHADQIEPNLSRGCAWCLAHFRRALARQKTMTRDSDQLKQ
jgi:hypothetical protein